MLENKPVKHMEVTGWATPSPSVVFQLCSDTSSLCRESCHKTLMRSDEKKSFASALRNLLE